MSLVVPLIVKEPSKKDESVKIHSRETMKRGVFKRNANELFNALPMDICNQLKLEVFNAYTHVKVGRMLRFVKRFKQHV